MLSFYQIQIDNHTQHPDFCAYQRNHEEYKSLRSTKWRKAKVKDRTSGGNSLLKFDDIDCDDHDGKTCLGCRLRM